MGYRPSNDPFGGVAPIADNLIGTAYDTVRAVASSIAEVKHVSANLELIHGVHENIADVVAVAGSLESLGSVAGAAAAADASADAAALSAAAASASAAAAALSVGAAQGDVLAIIGVSNAATATALSAGADRTKLNGIAAGATANSPDATLLNRANHTGTQAISTVATLQAALDAKAPLTSLDAKAPLASPTFTGIVTAPTFSGALTGNVTGTVSGNAGTATKLATPRTINGVSFDGTANITIAAGGGSGALLTRGAYLTGSNYDGSAATTWDVDATSANTASTVVARDAGGNFSAGTITASLAGNASTATALSAGSDRTKLDGIQAGATANSSNTVLLDRSNHTGTQAWSTITGTPTTLAGYGITDGGGGGSNQPLDADLTALAALASNGLIARTGAGTVAVRSISGSARITVSNGDGIAGSPAIDLASGVVGAGTYRSVTVDTYGRVTSGTNPTTVSGYGITDAAPLASPAFTGTPTTTGNMGFGGAALNNTGYSTITVRGSSGGVIELTGSAGTQVGRLYADAAASNVYLMNQVAGNLILGASGGEQMRITSTGDIYMGQTTISAPGFGNTTTGTAIQKAGRIFVSGASFSNFNINGNGVLHNYSISGTGVGNVTVSGSTTSFNTTSDYRLKENVEALTGASYRVSLLKPKRFSFKADPDHTMVDGFIAHEVQEVVPLAVTGNKDGDTMQSMDAGKLVPLLTAALQEALTRIDGLTDQVADLTGRITALEAAQV